MEAGNRLFSSDTVRPATNDEMKEVVAKQIQELGILKKIQIQKLVVSARGEGYAA